MMGEQELGAWENVHGDEDSTAKAFTAYMTDRSTANAFLRELDRWRSDVIRGVAAVWHVPWHEAEEAIGELIARYVATVSIGDVPKAPSRGSMKWHPFLLSSARNLVCRRRRPLSLDSILAHERESIEDDDVRHHEPLELEGPGPAPDRESCERESVERLLAKLHGMLRGARGSETAYRIIVARAEGRNFAEIAALLGRSAGGCRVTLAKARRVLFERLRVAA